MHQPRYALATTLGLNGKLYALGGFNRASGGYLNTVEIYDPVAQTWTFGPSLSVPRAYLAAATGPDGRIYAIGGRNNDAASLDVVEVYNPATNQWSRVQPLSVPRRDHDVVDQAEPHGTVGERVVPRRARGTEPRAPLDTLLHGADRRARGG